MSEEIDREKALLCLKWLIVSNIDGYWGAGDAHLFMLRLLQALDPDDETIENLYNHLKAKAEACAGSPSYEEDVYRDEGKEEAQKYEEEIKRRYGEEFFDKLWHVYIRL